MQVNVSTIAATAIHRKAKQLLLTDGVEGLQKKVKKGKGVTKVLVEERQRRVSRLLARATHAAS